MKWSPVHSGACARARRRSLERADGKWTLRAVWGLLQLRNCRCSMTAWKRVSRPGAGHTPLTGTDGRLTVTHGP